MTPKQQRDVLLAQQADLERQQAVGRQTVEQGAALFHQAEGALRLVRAWLADLDKLTADADGLPTPPPNTPLDEKE